MRRTKEALRAQRIIWCGLLVATVATAQIPAGHRHWRGACDGQLGIDENGVAFQSTRKKDHNWRWGWLDIQQFEALDNGEIRILTYKDNKWRLGADRELHFNASHREVAKLAPLLRAKLDRRFVAGIAEPAGESLWELPVKHLLRFSGSEGTLVVAEHRILYRTETLGESRTWYFADIDNISSSGPDQLTITTFERARGHYGNRKGFNFALKRPLDEARYNDLWRRFERAKGVQTIQNIRSERAASLSN